MREFLGTKGVEIDAENNKEKGFSARGSFWIQRLTD